MMQTQALPIQVSSASPAPTRATGMANTDSSQFSQALSREIEQRQNSAAAASQAAPAKAQAAPAQQAPAQAADSAQAAASAQAKAADGKPAGAAASGDGADNAKDDAADAAAVTPVADMLALVASFNQPVAVAPDADPAAAAAAAVAAAASQAAGLPGSRGKPAREDAGIAAFARVAADGKGRPAGEGAAATDAAAAFALKMPPADVAPKGAAGVPKAAAGVGEATKRGSGALEAVAGPAAQTDDGHDAAAATFKAAADKAAPQGAPVQPDQLRTREADVAALKDLPAAAPLTAPAQQASTAISQAAVGAPADRIAARVGTPGWDNQVGQKIVWMVAGKEQSASLTLNPPDMGPMQVVLNVTNDQATVTFTAAQPEVRQALENAMPKLREMMGESGIALGNATVNAGSPDQRQAQQGEQSRGGGSGGRFGGGGGSGETAIGAATARPLRAGDGLVDTFA